MVLQNYQKISEAIKNRYIREKRNDPERFLRHIDYSWSIWMFGKEPLEQSLNRLKKYGIQYVELKGEDTPDSVRFRKALSDTGIKLSGICGLFSSERDLAGIIESDRHHAIAYIQKQTKMVHDLGGSYLIVVPGAVGRSQVYDSEEMQRSAATLRTCAECFSKYEVAAAIEPIRSAEVSIVHTVREALAYLDFVDDPSVRHINGDIFHMLNGERHIGNAILLAGERLVNLHLADSNRDAPGKGMIDIDTVLMASYLVGMNQPGRFLTFEPLGPYPDPYVLSTSLCNVKQMDRLVEYSVRMLKEREEIVRQL
jgi:sugar phosphate isomerase/epimerase